MQPSLYNIILSNSQLWSWSHVETYIAIHVDQAPASFVDGCYKRDVTIHQQSYSDGLHHLSAFCSGSSSIDGSAGNTWHTNTNAAVHHATPIAHAHANFIK